MKPVAVVTGASRGIGLAVARDLVRTHHVFVGGSDQARVQSVVAELGDASPFVADLLEEAAVESAAATVQRCDLLVHSAAIEQSLSVADTSRDTWRRMFEINVFAVAQLTALLLPLLRKARGQVIAINSGSGFRSGARASLYSGTKFALRAFTDALRAEERGLVRVTSIHPGRVDTDMQRVMQERDGNNYDPSFYLRPESVAATVRFAVEATPEASIDELQIRPIRP